MGTSLLGGLFDFQMVEHIMSTNDYKEPTEYCDPDQEETPSEALPNKHERDENTLLGSPPLQKVVLYNRRPSEVGHVKRWLT